MAVEGVKLKYLFRVLYSDGTIFEQTPDDTSSLDPKRSQFYDVLQSGKEISQFSLIGEEGILSVDLLSGIFVLNGFGFIAESIQLPAPPDKFNLVFYRQHTHTIQQIHDLHEKKILEQEESSHIIQYFLGWECDIAGKHYIQKIGLI